MKRLWLGILAALLAIVAVATPALAIALPDSTPTVISFHAYRNILETGDILVVIYENTPYATPPSSPSYDGAFIWRWMDAAGTTELADAVGYPYHSYGYGYNVISFYLNAANVTAKGIVWGTAYKFTLTGTPAAFTTIPSYSFTIPSSAYSSLTTTSDVKERIAVDILVIAKDLDIKWGLTSDYYLVSESETGTVLSDYGASFFRGAIYGIQGLAPGLFPFAVNNIARIDYTFTSNYSTALAGQLTGSNLGNAMTAMNTGLGVNWNLVGLLVVLAITGSLIFANWRVANKAMVWAALLDSGAILIIASRISLLEMGICALIEAVCWIYVSLRLWRFV